MLPRYLSQRSSDRRFAARLAALAFAAAALGCQSNGSDEDTTAPAAGAVGDPNDARARAADVASPSPVAERIPTNEAPAASQRADTAEPAPAGGGASTAPAASRPASSAPAASFASCIKTRGTYSDCDAIYITMTQSSPARCVQLTLDNCGGYGRRGLSVDLAPSWRLESASVSASAAPCELGVFYPSSTVIGDASGSISWNESTQKPTEIELQVTLEGAGAGAGAASVEVVTSEPLEPGPCED